ncbi:C1 family peptidase [Paenibacillus mendelii]|uniref:C1 family peptidase n=1 Tax=Paenibacillus mendelii TaxID=206163 RepID=A0ABV6J9T5_9BACL|nr:C1 family peptidase [Paenibacillus mendelii]MCQ6563983.1 C1 family peptidase [Paenibacillus mendelii]
MNNYVSLEEIKSALSEHGDPWVAGGTSLSFLPSDEKKQYLGASPPPDVPSIDEIEQRVFAMREAIETEGLHAVRENTARDLRDVEGKNYVTPIKNQKRCGSCVAFATIATVESTLQIQQQYPSGIDLSEAHLFFCLGNALGGTCENGWWPKQALDRFKDEGVYGESVLKYDEALARNPHCTGYDFSPEYYFKITGYVDLTGQPALIKEWIDKKGPVIASLIVYEDLYEYKTGVYKHVAGEKSGSHCVSIIGYNDSDGCWICKNSWGTDWGEEGFFRITYGECAIHSWANYGVRGVTVIHVPEPEPGPDDCTEYDCPPDR